MPDTCGDAAGVRFCLKMFLKTWRKPNGSSVSARWRRSNAKKHLSMEAGDAAAALKLARLAPLK
jgi:hypothetical protein